MKTFYTLKDERCVCGRCGLTPTFGYRQTCPNCGPLYLFIGDVIHEDDGRLTSPVYRALLPVRSQQDTGYYVHNTSPSAGYRDPAYVWVPPLVIEHVTD